MGSLTLLRLLACITCFLTVYIVLRAASIIHLLYFHPLRSFPGPRLAVATRWYRGYFDVILQGEWLRQLEYLHTIYGELLCVELQCHESNNVVTYRRSGQDRTKRSNHLLALARRPCSSFTQGSFRNTASIRRDICLRISIYKGTSALQVFWDG